MRVPGCAAKLTLTPRNTVATLQQQDTTVLSCKTDKSGTRINWFFGSEKNTIFSGFKENEGYRVSMNLEAGEFNVSLGYLNASYAGQYICVEPGSGQRASARLVVLGKFISIICHLSIKKSCTGERHW